jgi:esterase/lipase
LKRMDTETKHAIGVMLLVLGGLLTLWTAGAYIAIQDMVTLAAVVSTGTVAVIGLVMLFLK